MLGIHSYMYTEQQLFSQHKMNPSGIPYNSGLELMSYRYGCKKTHMALLHVEAVFLYVLIIAFPASL